MKKKLTITLDVEVYNSLCRRVGRRRVGAFIESLLIPYVEQPDLREGYRQMAADEAHGAEALEWAEATIAG